MSKLENSPTDVSELAEYYSNELGGLDNIQTVDACITRLRVSLKDMSAIDEAKLKRLGAMGVVKLDEHKLQVIIGPKADCIAQAIKALKSIT